MGKGSGRRPARISARDYEQNYTRTFGTAMHQNPPHPDSATSTTATQSVQIHLTSQTQASHS